jgi:hypothetical protein
MIVGMTDPRLENVTHTIQRRVKFLNYSKAASLFLP